MGPEQIEASEAPNEGRKGIYGYMGRLFCPTAIHTPVYTRY